MQKLLRDLRMHFLALDLSFGDVAWDHSRGHFRLESVQLRNFSLGSLVWELSLGIFRWGSGELGSSGWGNPPPGEGKPTSQRWGYLGVRRKLLSF